MLCGTQLSLDINVSGEIESHGQSYIKHIHPKNKNVFTLRVVWNGRMVLNGDEQRWLNSRLKVAFDDGQEQKNEGADWMEAGGRALETKD